MGDGTRVNIPSGALTRMPVDSSVRRISEMLKMAAEATAGKATNLDNVALVLGIDSRAYAQRSSH